MPPKPPARYRNRSWMGFASTMPPSQAAVVEHSQFGAGASRAPEPTIRSGIDAPSEWAGEHDDAMSNCSICAANSQRAQETIETLPTQDNDECSRGPVSSSQNLTVQESSQNQLQSLIEKVDQMQRDLNNGQTAFQQRLTILETAIFESLTRDSVESKELEKLAAMPSQCSIKGKGKAKAHDQCQGRDPPSFHSLMKLVKLYRDLHEDVQEMIFTSLDTEISGWEGLNIQGELVRRAAERIWLAHQEACLLLNNSQEQESS